MCTDENNDKKNTNLPPPLPTHLIIFIKCIEKNTVNITVNLQMRKNE